MAESNRSNSAGAVTYWLQAQAAKALIQEGILAREQDIVMGSQSLSAGDEDGDNLQQDVLSEHDLRAIILAACRFVGADQMPESLEEIVAVCTRWKDGGALDRARYGLIVEGLVDVGWTARDASDDRYLEVCMRNLRIPSMADCC